MTTLFIFSLNWRKISNSCS